jgi:hypothetical protein
MVFKDIITIYKENDMKLIDMLCEQNAELLTVKAGGTQLPLGFNPLRPSGNYMSHLV